MVDISKVKFRLDKALDCIATADADVELGHLYSAANRSYYAIYNSMRAVHAFDNYESKKHSGNISEFRRRYIKTGIFDAKLSDVIEDSYELRQKCDYEDHFAVKLPDVTKQLENARHFYEKVKLHIDNTCIGSPCVQTAGENVGGKHV